MESLPQPNVFCSKLVMQPIKDLRLHLHVQRGSQLTSVDLRPSAASSEKRSIQKSFVCRSRSSTSEIKVHPELAFIAWIAKVTCCFEPNATPLAIHREETATAGKESEMTRTVNPPNHYMPRKTQDISRHNSDQDRDRPDESCVGGPQVALYTTSRRRCSKESQQCFTSHQSILMFKLCSST